MRNKLLALSSLLILNTRKKMQKIYFRSSSQANLRTKPRGKSPMEKWAEAKEKLEKLQKEIELLKPESKAAEKKSMQITKTASQLAVLDAKKNDPHLSKSFVKEVLKTFIGLKYDRHESIENKYTRKGTESEEAGITIYSMYRQMAFFKNETRLYNDEYHITGEPDLFIPNDINNPDIRNAKETIDIKCSWNIHTWSKSIIEELKSVYFDQGNNYMVLTGAKKHTVAFILLSTPYIQVLDEIRKETFKYDFKGDNDLPDWMKIKIVKESVYEKETLDKYLEALNIYVDQSIESLAMYKSFIEIPYDERVFEFTFDRDETEFEEIKKINQMAVDYMQSQFFSGKWKQGIQTED